MKNTIIGLGVIAILYFLLKKGKTNLSAISNDTKVSAQDKDYESLPQDCEAFFEKDGLLYEYIDGKFYKSNK
jgi:hypothetical protein